MSAYHDLPKSPCTAPDHELPVLDVERPIEAEEVPVALELLLARVLGQEEEHGIAEDVQDEEGEHGDAEDDDHELDELAGDVASHHDLVRPSPSSLLPAAGRRDGPTAAERAPRPLEGSALAPTSSAGVTMNIRSISSRGAS